MARMLSPARVEVQAGRVRGYPSDLISKAMDGLSWEEPLSAYHGVIADHDLTHRIFTVVLKHRSNDRRDGGLYVANDPEGLRARTKALARELDKPVLAGPVDGQFIERDVTDLDKSVAELVAEQKLTARKPRRPMASSRIRTGEHNDENVIELRQLRNLLRTLVGLTFAAGFFWGGYEAWFAALGRSGELSEGNFYILAAALIGAGIASLYMIRQNFVLPVIASLKISGGRIIINGDPFDAPHIEHVGAIGASGSYRVQILTRTESFELGDTLAKEEVEFVVQTILSAAAR